MLKSNTQKYALYFAIRAISETLHGIAPTNSAEEAEVILRSILPLSSLQRIILLIQNIKLIDRIWFITSFRLGRLMN